MRWCALLILMMISSPSKVVMRYFFAKAMIFLPWLRVGSVSNRELTIVSGFEVLMEDSMPVYKLSHVGAFLL